VHFASSLGHYHHGANSSCHKRSRKQGPLVELSDFAVHAGFTRIINYYWSLGNNLVLKYSQLCASVSTYFFTFVFQSLDISLFFLVNLEIY
jgi:hypothetical protein